MIVETEDDDRDSAITEGPAASLRVLVADDQTVVTRPLVRWFDSQAPAWTTHAVHDSESALERILSGTYDVVLLDWDFRDAMSGLEVCRRARASGSSVPIVMHTGVFENIDARMRAFEAGANDFVLKGTLPASELHKKLALVFLVAQVERPSRPPQPVASVLPQSSSIVTVGPLRIHVEMQAVSVNDELVRLGPHQQGLIVRLARSVGEVVSSEDLCGASRLSPGRAYKNLHNEMSRLRERLGPEAAKHIHTVRASGYRLT